MKVLSWDVGILNLAYCLINYEDDKWEIEDWGIINISERKDFFCIECNKKATLTFVDKFNSEYYYCGRHKPNNENLIPKFEDVFTNKSDDTCSWFNKKQCDKKSKYILNNQHCFCNTHSKTTFNNILKGYEIKKISKKSINKTSTEDIKLNLIKELDKRKHFLECNVVLIENQPSMKNPKMKAISSTISDYFIIRGIIDKEINNSNLNLVKFMSPSNKLKLVDNGDKKELIKLKGDESKTYKLTKALSVKYTNELIENMPQWKTVFGEHKKQDDLADALLQGLYYIINVL